MADVFEDKMEDQADLIQQRHELQKERQQLKTERQLLTNQLIDATRKNESELKKLFHERILKIDEEIKVSNEEIIRLDNMLAAAQGVFFNIYFVIHYSCCCSPIFYFP